MPDTLAYDYCHSLPKLKDNGTTLEEYLILNSIRFKKLHHLFILTISQKPLCSEGKIKSEMLCAYLRAPRANSSTLDINLSSILTTI